MARPNKLIQFYLTNVCNSKCKTCNIWQNKNVEELNPHTVIQTFSDLKDADYVFGGGEFSLYNGRTKLLNEADRMGISYTVLTNAVSLMKLEKLLASHNIKNLTISCDGTRHNDIRGSYRNRENIESVIAVWGSKIPNIKISYTLSKFNESHIDEDIAYFKFLGFNKIYFCIAQNMDLLNAVGDITPNIESLKYLYESYGYMLYDKDLQLLHDIINGVHRRCDSTENVHTIYTNGNVVRCQSMLSCNVIGNINEKPLKEILAEDEKKFKDVGAKLICPFNDVCELVCQRRYDYEDRV